MSNQLDEWRIFNEIDKLREEFLNSLEFKELRKKKSKFIGALTTEILRRELINLGFEGSNRDVFIEGCPYEIDLLILKKSETPQVNLLYAPHNILAVIEIKFNDSYGEKDPQRVKQVFVYITTKNPQLQCFYITISEVATYKYRIATETLGYACFELFTRKGDLELALKKKQMQTISLGAFK